MSWLADAFVVRAVIAAATIAVLVCMYVDDRGALAPIKQIKNDYCSDIDLHEIEEDELGQPQIVWGKGWGPCSLLDRYENI